MAAAAKRRVVVTAMQKVDGDGRAPIPTSSRRRTTRRRRGGARGGEVKLVAGTAWLFARPGMEEHARRARSSTRPGRCRSPTWSRSARRRATSCCSAIRSSSPQPTKGTHPAGAGSSALEHLLDGHADRSRTTAVCSSTKTWRMHPDDLRVHLGAVLRGPAQLASTRALGQRVLGGGAARRAVGCAGSPSSTPATSSSSDEEVDGGRAAATTSLIGRDWIDANGDDGADRRSTTCSSSRRTTRRCTLIGRPARRRASRHRRQVPGAGGGGRRSCRWRRRAPPTCPAGLEFLLSANRLNVAVSRARALAIVVASPTLLTTECRSLRTDPTRQRPVPLRRARARLSAAALTIRPARLVASGCPPPADRRCTTGGSWRGPARNT